MASLPDACPDNLDADLEQCSSVPLPPLEKVVLLGWPYEKDLSHVELHHQHGPSITTTTTNHYHHHHHHHLQRQPSIRLTDASTPHPRLRHHQSLQVCHGIPWSLLAWDLQVLCCKPQSAIHTCALDVEAKDGSACCLV